MEAGKRSGLDLVLGIWHRRKWLALLVFAFPFAAAAGVGTFLPNIYEATATILVERQQVPEALVRPTVTTGLDTRLQTISQESLGRSRLEELIQRFGLYRNLREQVSAEEVIGRMRKDIRLALRGNDPSRRAGGGTTVAFAISYQGSEPQTVAQVANALASFFIEENLKVRERQATGTAQFLKVQLDEVKKRIDQQETSLGDFKKRYMGELPQQMQANLATLDQLSQQLRLNADAQIRAGERREALSRQLVEATAVVPIATVTADGRPVPVTASPADPTAARLARLRQELSELRTRFTDRYPDVVRLKTEIATLEEELFARPKPESSPDVGAPRTPQPPPPVPPQVVRLRQLLDETEAEIKVLKAEEGRIRASMVAYRQRVENAPRREQELLELSRDYDTTKALYVSLTTRHDEAQLAESMEQRQKGEQFRVLDPAMTPVAPAAPNRPRLLAIALALSLGLAVGAVVLAEHLDSSFHAVDDLRAFTTAPVLASIPRIVTAADRTSRRRRFRLAAVSVAVGLAGIVTGAYFFARGNEQLVGLLLTGFRS